MKILGAGSLASRLRLLLDIVLVGWLIVGALNAFLLLSLTIEPTHPMRHLLNVTTLYAVPAGICAPAGLMESRDRDALVETQWLAFVNYRPGSRGCLFALSMGYFGLWGLYFGVIRQLKRVFVSLTSGQPFLRSNVHRIRIIGWMLIAAWLFHHAWDWGAVTYMRSVLTLAGQVPSVPTAFIIDDIRPEMLFVGAAVLVLAEIFRLGASLQEEQTLTI
jgi:hypothetical protein